MSSSQCSQDYIIFMFRLLFLQVLIICYFWASVNRVYQLFHPAVFWLSAVHIFFASLQVWVLFVTSCWLNRLCCVQGFFNAMIYGLTPSVKTEIRIQLTGTPCCPHGKFVCCCRTVDSFNELELSQPAVR